MTTFKILLRSRYAHIIFGIIRIIGELWRNINLCRRRLIIPYYFLELFGRTYLQFRNNLE